MREWGKRRRRGGEKRERGRGRGLVYIEKVI